MKARLIIITNETKDGDAPGQIDGFTRFVELGLLESVKVFSHRIRTRPNQHVEILAQIKRKEHDILLIFSPGIYPASQSQFDELLAANGGKPILYWEGDAWGIEDGPHLMSRKNLTEQMKWWLESSSLVFTHAGYPQVQEFKKCGAKVVINIPQTYCHLQFSSAEKFAPVKRFKNDGILIGSNLSRLPGITGLPGSWSRMRLAYTLKAKNGSNFQIFGKNWFPKISEGPIPYRAQSDLIRNFRLSVNWDHFPHYENYTSDRFPISLISGRPHLTTLHPNSTDFPNEELGVFRASKVSSAVLMYQDILGLGDEKIFQLGTNAWKWARNRLSHREAAQFILSRVIPDIVAPKIEPWILIP